MSIHFLHVGRWWGVGGTGPGEVILWGSLAHVWCLHDHMSAYLVPSRPTAGSVVDPSHCPRPPLAASWSESRGEVDGQTLPYAVCCRRRRTCARSDVAATATQTFELAQESEAHVRSQGALHSGPRAPGKLVGSDSQIFTPKHTSAPLKCLERVSHVPSMC